MYVFGPMLKEGIKKFVTYQVGGDSLENQITRRYSDFFALREKLQERWPGIYIPNVPPKKAVGNTDPKTIEKRERMLNIFCFKLSTLPYLFNSEEVKVFKTAGTETAKAIQALPKASYEEIKNRYSQSFENYNDGYDLIFGLNRLNDFNEYLKGYQTNIKQFQESVNKSLDKKKHQIERYLHLMVGLAEHEKNTLLVYSQNQDEDKLVISNPKNNELYEKIVNLKESLVNPFITLNDWLDEEQVDIEAMLEAMASLKGLETTKTKLNQKLETLTSDIENFKSSGKKTFTMMFKNSDNAITEMEKEKETTENNIQFIGEIQKMAAFNMEWYVERFKKEKTYEYFRHFKAFVNLQRKNTVTIDNLWKTVKNCMVGLEP